MTSAELTRRAKLQEWSARIQDCRSSGLSATCPYGLCRRCQIQRERRRRRIRHRVPRLQGQRLGRMRNIPPASCKSALKRSPPCISKRSWTVSARTPPVSGIRKPISWRRCSIPFPPSTTTMPCWSITIFTAAPKGRHFSCPIPGERI